MCDKNDDIKLVFYSSITDKHFEKMFNIIPVSFPEDKIFYCNEINEFSLKLRDVLSGFGIVIVLVRNKNELNEIFQMGERLKNQSLIMILSDEIDDMDQQAIRLYPRYTTYIKNNYKDVSQVLNRMIDQIENKTKGEINGRSY